MKMHIKFWLGILKGRDHSEDLGIIKVDLRETWCEAVGWIYLA
jgi:hypothetical protein